MLTPLAQPSLRDADEVVGRALEPGRHHHAVVVPDGAKARPVAGVAPHGPVLDELAQAGGDRSADRSWGLREVGRDAPGARSPMVCGPTIILPVTPPATLPMNPPDEARHDREAGSRDSMLDTTRIDDVRIGAVRPLITPALLQERVPVSADTLSLVEAQPGTARGARAWPPRQARGRRRSVLDPRPRRGDRLRRAPEGGGRRASWGSLHRHARLFREAAHDRRLEGLHQRPSSRRHVRHQRRPRAGALAAARADDAGHADGHRVPRPAEPAVHR